jgi:hypothetical protein
LTKTCFSYKKTYPDFITKTGEAKGSRIIVLG